jgi:hypothetical protein
MMKCDQESQQWNVKLCEMQITIFECERYASKFFLEENKYVCVDLIEFAI